MRRCRPGASRAGWRSRRESPPGCGPRGAEPLDRDASGRAAALDATALAVGRLAAALARAPRHARPLGAGAALAAGPLRLGGLLRDRRLADGAELRRVGRACAVGARRVTGSDVDPDLAVAAVEDVVAVARRVHPRLYDRGGGRERAGAPGEVLADAPGAVLGEVAGALDPLEDARAVATGVGEVRAGNQVLRVRR